MLLSIGNFIAISFIYLRLGIISTTNLPLTFNSIIFEMVDVEIQNILLKQSVYTKLL